LKNNNIDIFILYYIMSYNLYDKLHQLCLLETELFETKYNEVFQVKLNQYYEFKMNNEEKINYYLQREKNYKKIIEEINEDRKEIKETLKAKEKEINELYKVIKENNDKLKKKKCTQCGEVGHNKRTCEK